MTGKEQLEVLDRAREAGKFAREDLGERWRRAHESQKAVDEPSANVLACARAIVREVEEFLGERLADRLGAFTILVLGFAYVQENRRNFWWVAGYNRALSREFEEMP